MINDIQSKAIDMLIEGKANKIDIAKACGKSRTWLYDSVINDDECRANMDERLHDLKIDGEKKIMSKVDMYIAELDRIALTSKSENTKKDVLMYLLNRIYGNPTSKLETNDNSKENESINEDILQNELELFKKKKID
ncbi:hypothetical protein [Clostridium pasteurianum]|uniref:Uncharacterized protein n=1 Tax=Clostridium pasteurianum BC1 TaxID=86416 RepID=R4K4Z5_CLOPA|nr:hypothetical protein [Clostridium pasteurianum]AGK97638.1 hypothetical protein Clopa_2800 [Clostridium pasteurianum BC1]